MSDDGIQKKMNAGGGGIWNAGVLHNIILLANNEGDLFLFL